MSIRKAYRTWFCDVSLQPRVADCQSFTGIRLLSQPVNAALTEIVEYLGRAAGVDRCWMFEYDDDLTRFRNTHEWCAHGITSHVEDLQDTPVSMIGWLQRSLVAGKAVMIDDVTMLPVAARALKREMLRQDDKSVLCVPVFHANQLRACIGFDMVRMQRIWINDEAALLSLCGRLIAEARYGDLANRWDIARENANAPLVYLGGGKKIRGVPFHAILAIRSMRNETRIWLDDGSVVIDRRPLHAWRTLLPAASFPTIHRTAIINITHIAMLDKHGGAGFHWQLRIRGIDDIWPVSRQYRRDLLERMGW